MYVIDNRRAAHPSLAKVSVNILKRSSCSKALNIKSWCQKDGVNHSDWHPSKNENY